MAAFMQLVRKTKVYKERRRTLEATYRAEYRFDEGNVEWLAEHFLHESQETRGGALSPKQQMEVFLRHIGDPGFQVGVGEDIDIHQTTVSKTFAKVLDQVNGKAQLWIRFP